MNTRSFVIVGVVWAAGVALALSMTGCKSASCESVCERKNGCEGQTQTPDCAEFCDQAAQLAETSDCTDEYDALLSCQGSIEICDSDTFCAAQNGAYLKCINDACSADPSICSGG